MSDKNPHVGLLLHVSQQEGAHLDEIAEIWPRQKHCLFLELHFHDSLLFEELFEPEVRLEQYGTAPDDQVHVCLRLLQLQNLFVHYECLWSTKPHHSPLQRAWNVSHVAAPGIEVLGDLFFRKLFLEVDVAHIFYKLLEKKLGLLAELAPLERVHERVLDSLLLLRLRHGVQFVELNLPDQIRGDQGPSFRFQLVL